MQPSSLTPHITKSALHLDKDDAVDAAVAAGGAGLGLAGLNELQRAKKLDSNVIGVTAGRLDAPYVSTPTGAGHVTPARAMYEALEQHPAVRDTKEFQLAGLERGMERGQDTIARKGSLLNNVLMEIDHGFGSAYGSPIGIGPFTPVQKSPWHVNPFGRVSIAPDPMRPAEGKLNWFPGSFRNTPILAKLLGAKQHRVTYGPDPLVLGDFNTKAHPLIADNTLEEAASKLRSPRPKSEMLLKLQALAEKSGDSVSAEAIRAAIARKHNIYTISGSSRGDNVAIRTQQLLAELKEQGKLDKSTIIAMLGADKGKLPENIIGEHPSVARFGTVPSDLYIGAQDVAHGNWGSPGASAAWESMLSPQPNVLSTNNAQLRDATLKQIKPKTPQEKHHAAQAAEIDNDKWNEGTLEHVKSLPPEEGISSATSAKEFLERIEAAHKDGLTKSTARAARNVDQMTLDKKRLANHLIEHAREVRAKSQRMGKIMKGVGATALGLGGAAAIGGIIHAMLRRNKNSEEHKRPAATPVEKVGNAIAMPDWSAQRPSSRIAPTPPAAPVAPVAPATPPPAPAPAVPVSTAGNSPLPSSRPLPNEVPPAPSPSLWQRTKNRVRLEAPPVASPQPTMEQVRANWPKPAGGVPRRLTGLGARAGGAYLGLSTLPKAFDQGWNQGNWGQAAGTLTGGAAMAAPFLARDGRKLSGLIPGAGALMMGNDAIANAQNGNYTQAGVAAEGAGQAGVMAATSGAAKKYVPAAIQNAVRNYGGSALTKAIAPVYNTATAAMPGLSVAPAWGSTGVVGRAAGAVNSAVASPLLTGAWAYSAAEGADALRHGNALGYTDQKVNEYMPKGVNPWGGKALLGNFAHGLMDPVGAVTSAVGGLRQTFQTNQRANTELAMQKQFTEANQARWKQEGEAAEAKARQAQPQPAPAVQPVMQPVQAQPIRKAGALKYRRASGVLDSDGADWCNAADLKKLAGFVKYAGLTEAEYAALPIDPAGMQSMSDFCKKAGRKLCKLDVVVKNLNKTAKLDTIVKIN